MALPSDYISSEQPLLNPEAIQSSSDVITQALQNSIANNPNTQGQASQYINAMQPGASPIPLGGPGTAANPLEYMQDLMVAGATPGQGVSSSGLTGGGDTAANMLSLYAHRAAARSAEAQRLDEMTRAKSTQGLGWLEHNQSAQLTEQGQKIGIAEKQAELGIQLRGQLIQLMQQGNVEAERAIKSVDDYYEAGSKNNAIMHTNLAEGMTQWMHDHPEGGGVGPRGPELQKIVQEAASKTRGISPNPSEGAKAPTPNAEAASAPVGSSLSQNMITANAGPVTGAVTPNSDMSRMTRQGYIESRRAQLAPDWRINTDAGSISPDHAAHLDQLQEARNQHAEQVAGAEWDKSQANMNTANTIGTGLTDINSALDSLHRLENSQLGKPGMAWDLRKGAAGALSALGVDPDKNQQVYSDMQNLQSRLQKIMVAGQRLPRLASEFTAISNSLASTALAPQEIERNLREVEARLNAEADNAGVSQDVQKFVQTVKDRTPAPVSPTSGFFKNMVTGKPATTPTITREMMR